MLYIYPHKPQGVTKARDARSEETEWKECSWKTHAIQEHQRHGGAGITFSLVHSRICESISIADISKEQQRKAEQRDLPLDTNSPPADVIAKARPTGEHYLVFAAHETTLL